MPINYEHEKQKFFETYDFKVGDKIVIPMRSGIIATITEICPKYLRVLFINKDGKKIKLLEYYTQNNKYKGDFKPYIQL